MLSSEDILEPLQGSSTQPLPNFLATVSCFNQKVFPVPPQVGSGGGGQGGFLFQGQLGRGQESEEERGIKIEIHLTRARKCRKANGYRRQFWKVPPSGQHHPSLLLVKGKGQHQHKMPQWTPSVLTAISEPSGLETNCNITVPVAYTINKMAYK